VNVERLTELQEKLEHGQPFDLDECAALIAEIWRLKTVIAGKSMEARSARDESSDLQISLDETRAEIASLRRQVEELKDIHGLPACDLERRWSNCAVRIRKRAASKAPPAAGGR
jgi:predicted  nucleic acid-binding Zn-ribbon protein